MKRAIAKIRLAPGNAGWFDPLTNIYLTLSKKECFVYNDQDISNIRKAIKQNKLILKEGRLPSPASKDKHEIIEDEPVVKKQVKKKKEIKDKVIEQIEVIEEKDEIKTERTRKKVKRKPDDSKLQKQEEENKEEVKQNDVVENSLVKVAELIKDKDKTEEDNNG